MFGWTIVTIVYYIDHSYHLHSCFPPISERFLGEIGSCSRFDSRSKTVARSHQGFGHVKRTVQQLTLAPPNKKIKTDRTIGCLETMGKDLQLLEMFPQLSWLDELSETAVTTLPVVRMQTSRKSLCSRLERSKAWSVPDVSCCCSWVGDRFLRLSTHLVETALWSWMAN